MQTYDVIIVGGGMVGLAVACGLQHSGVRVAVLEKEKPASISGSSDPKSALRVSAINAASERLLQHLGVWKSVLTSRTSAYHGVEVWDRDSFGHITFDARQQGLTHLGHIIENCAIHQALWQHAESLSNITMIASAELQQVIFGDKEAFVTLKDGSVMSVRLLVAADGANSWLRNKTDIPLTFWDYQHNALVANVRSEKQHNTVARQIFHGDGILAFLPLNDPHLCSIVWSLPLKEANRIFTMPELLFNQQLSVVFDLRLGLCSVESERRIFPLIGRCANNFTAYRLALVGDAAHTIHPLAGQGVNLGFMDAAELIGEIRRLHQQNKDIGQHIYLRRYERRRKYRAAVMLASMHGLCSLFNGNHPMKKFIRDVGLVLADKLPEVKIRLIRQAMGLNDLPEWLQ